MCVGGSDARHHHCGAGTTQRQAILVIFRESMTDPASVARRLEDDGGSGFASPLVATHRAGSAQVPLRGSIGITLVRECCVVASARRRRKAWHQH